MPLLALLTPRTFFWAGIFLLCAALGIQTVRLSAARSDLAIEQADRAKAEKERADAAVEYVQKLAVIQQAHAVTQQRISDEFEQERKSLADAAAVASADADELRRAVEAFSAARAGSTDADTGAAERFKHQARTLGELFREADRLAEEMARAAERRNAEVRVLQRQILADRAACDAPRQN